MHNEGSYGWISEGIKRSTHNDIDDDNNTNKKIEHCKTPTQCHNETDPWSAFGKPTPHI